ncbi:hypothetical protein Lal_00007608 [Lupinus albus]|nr:hypothetical protein Lal_00007608 [Lupinus albus]
MYAHTHCPSIVAEGRKRHGQNRQSCPKPVANRKNTDKKEMRRKCVRGSGMMNGGRRSIPMRCSGRPIPKRGQVKVLEISWIGSVNFTTSVLIKTHVLSILVVGIMVIGSGTYLGIAPHFLGNMIDRLLNDIKKCVIQSNTKDSWELCHDKSKQYFIKSASSLSCFFEFQILFEGYRISLASLPRQTINNVCHA